MLAQASTSTGVKGDRQVQWHKQEASMQHTFFKREMDSRARSRPTYGQGGQSDSYISMLVVLSFLLFPSFHSLFRFFSLPF